MDPLHHLARLVFYRVRTVPVRDCVHYCGFRYGRDEFNPYEQYMRGLLAGAPYTALRDEFRDFLLHFRPRNLGEALSVALEHSPPLWQLPWRRPSSLTPRGWRATAAEIPDVLTHFSEEGVPGQQILEEYKLLEGAADAIRRVGYQPKRYSYIRVFELRAEAGSAYIVADGNHRLSCLSAMGREEVDVVLAPVRTAHRRRSHSWPAVRKGRIGEADALRIFDAYFRGNQTPYRAAMPATVTSTAR